MNSYHYETIICPFSPEDYMFLEEHFTHIPDDIFYTNSVNEIIKKMSEYDVVVSFGRLHPMIFAKNIGIPIISIGNKLDKVTKIEIFSHELDCQFNYIEDIQNIEDNIKNVKNIIHRTYDNSNIKCIKERINNQIKEIINLFIC